MLLICLFIVFVKVVLFFFIVVVIILVDLVLYGDNIFKLRLLFCDNV